MRRSGWIATLILSIVLFSGCTKQIRQKKVQTVTFSDAMVFHVKGGKVVRIEQYSVKELFQRGAVAFQQQKYKEALAYYRRIVKYFTKQKHYHQPSMYNMALCFERLGQAPQAVALYQQILKRFPGTSTARDATFRLGANLIQQKRWAEAEKIYAKIVQMPELEVADKIEAMASLGVTQHEQDKLVLAESTYRATIRLYRKASRKEFLGNDYFAAMAQFRLGMIYDKRFRSRKFRASQDAMKQDLESKAADLLLAQAHYIRTIRIRNPQWIVASLFRIGELYRGMYHDMLKAPIPGHLSDKEKRVYVRMLKNRIQVLLQKAIYAFEKNIRMAETLGLSNHNWVKRTRKQLKQLREFIVKEYLSEPKEDPKAGPTSRPAAGQTPTAPAARPAAPTSRPTAPAARPAAPTTPPATRKTDDKKNTPDDKKAPKKGDPEVPKSDPKVPSTNPL